MYNSINSYTQDKKNCFSDGNIVMQLVIQGVKDIKIGKTFRKLKEKKILLDLSMVTYKEQGGPGILCVYKNVIYARYSFYNVPTH